VYDKLKLSNPNRELESRDFFPKPRFEISQSKKNQRISTPVYSSTNTKYIEKTEKGGTADN
jgi:hypothetical protein